MAEQQLYRELIDHGEQSWELEADPAIPPLLALAHAHRGERKEAEFFLGTSLAAAESLEPSARADAAAALIVLSRIEEAKSLLESVVADDPNHGMGLARLGFCHRLRGEAALALPLFERAAEARPGTLSIMANLADARLILNQPVEALADLDAGLETLALMQETLPAALYRQYWRQLHDMRFEALAQCGDMAGAERQLGQLAAQCESGALELDDLTHAVATWGHVLAERNQHSEAEDVLREWLKQLPECVPLYLELAQIAQVQGRAQQALSLLRRALKLEPENISAWIAIAAATKQSPGKQSQKAALRAVELADARFEEDEDANRAMNGLLRAQAHTALAQVYSEEQRYDEAEDRFRAVLSEHGDFLPALQGLGHQQLQRGQIDEAIALFERIKAIDPVRGHAALINARHFPEDPASLTAMEQVARIPSLEGPVRTGLLFQLAAAWQKRADYERAFALAEEANAAAKHLLDYDPKQHRKDCARIRDRFGTALFEHRPGMGIDSNAPVYVVGMPRSGTTLVEQILAGHSQIFGAGELGLIPSVIGGLNRWERHTGSGRTYPDCVDDLAPEVTERIASEVLKELQEYAPDARHIVDKLPHNFENVGLIKFLFPNARIISVRRDPRAIAMSNWFTDYVAKFGGMGFAYDLTHIGEQLADHNLLMHHWQQVFPGQILELQYEDVVDDLEGSARRMLDYVGVDWEPGVLDFASLDRPVKTASVWQVRQPIYRTSKDKWMHYRNKLGPLIRGTNAKIEPEPFDMISLPEPGLLPLAADAFNAGDLDQTELNVKKMLHHNPEHAACRYLLGLVYLRKGYFDEGILEIEAALENAPFHREWRESLAAAYRHVGRDEDADALTARRPSPRSDHAYAGAQ